MPRELEAAASLAWLASWLSVKIAGHEESMVAKVSGVWRGGIDLYSIFFCSAMAAWLFEAGVDCSP